MLPVTMIDYGVGNIHSLSKALARAGAEVTVTDDASRIIDAKALVLPGVGAFGAVAERLAPMRNRIKERMEAGIPAFAVCIGMQALFEESEEGPGEGIGLLRGSVRRLRHQRLPHIGWNEVKTRLDPIFEGVPAGTAFYFVHSFAPSSCTEHVIAEAHYGDTFAAGVRLGNTWGVQFHPEKSSAPGLRVIENWVRFAEATCS